MRRGNEFRDEVLGSSYAGSGKKDDPFYRHFYDFTIDHCWGNVWLRPGLDRKTRSMLNIVMLTAMGCWPELEITRWVLSIMASQKKKLPRSFYKPGSMPAYP